MSALEKLHPDIAVIQEIAEPKEQNNQCCWTYDTWAPKGVAVCTFNGWTVTPVAKNPAVPGIFLPVKIDGPVTFNLMAVWTMSKGKYIESLKPALEEYKDFLLPGNSVILGDFNSNKIWNKIHKTFNHTDTVEKLRDGFDHISAYHNFFNENQGAERTPTFFEQRNQQKPYHIDYCFVPKSWHIENVEVGTFDEWSGVSDHCPLIVDLLISDSDTKSEKNIIKPGKERFCADIVITGHAPVPESAKQLLKSVSERNASTKMK